MMVRWVRWEGGFRGFVLSAVVICLGASPAAAGSTSLDRTALPLTVGEFLSLEARLSGSEPSSATGFSVALSDDGRTALVGAPFEDCDAGSSCGAARVLARTGGTWIEQARLTASDRAAGDEFGTSVALSGDGSIALIGALRADCPTGSSCGVAYIFVRNGQSWSEAQKLFASDADGFDFFGISVDLSLDGSVALVGASRSEVAYVFTRIGGVWVETARLTPSSSFGSGVFGGSVSLSDDGTIALIGTPGGGCAGQSCGEVFVFVRSGAVWTEERKFTAADVAPIDQFGFSVSLSSDGETALVGSLSDDCEAGDQCGAAYVFARNGGLWTQLAKLTSPDNSGGDFFGFDVALAGDALHALIGAYGPCQAGGPCRVAYLFVAEGGQWREKQRLSVTRQCGGRLQGPSVDLSENADRALVGEHASTCPGEPGEAYVFGRQSSPLEIPVASGSGLAVLAIALAVIGLAMLRHKAGAAIKP
jgi:hypothetical protein